MKTQISRRGFRKAPDSIRREAEEIVQSIRRADEPKAMLAELRVTAYIGQNVSSYTLSVHSDREFSLHTIYGEGS